jgi:hypothetical protein
VTDEDPRVVALEACASGARVLVIKRDGEQFDAHVASLLHGGFRAVRKGISGYVEVTVWHAEVASMAAYIEPADDPFSFDGGEDELQALAQRLREEAHAEAQVSLAEKMLRDSERTS